MEINKWVNFDDNLGSLNALQASYHLRVSGVYRMRLLTWAPDGRAKRNVCSQSFPQKT